MCIKKKKDRRLNKNWEKRWKEIAKYDQDWDGEYLLKIILHKLRLMANYHSNESKVPLAPETRDAILKEIRSAIAIAERLEKNDYDKELNEFQDKHLKQTRTLKEDGTVAVEYQWVPKKDAKKLKDRWVELIDESAQAYQKDWHDFFSILEECLPGWWD